MDIILFDKICLYDEYKNETTIYGQYNNSLNRIIIDQLEYELVFCNDRPDFYIKIRGKILKIEKIIFILVNNEIKFTNINLCFPFENCDLVLKKTSSIISTFCKKYSHRLDEWIQYNLQLGFSGIVIFDNDGNITNPINEPYDDCIIEQSIEEICTKYKGKIWRVDCPYSQFNNKHYDEIQRITLHIGVNAFRDKCRNIALIDADEFIYIPQSPSMSIETFLQTHSTITMKSNILTNKNNNDLLHNNILQIAEYLGEDKYTKTILHTEKIRDNEFIITPHNHSTQEILNKDQIIHYHCWMNKRYIYNDSMEKIDFLKNINNKN